VPVRGSFGYGCATESIQQLRAFYSSRIFLIVITDSSRRRGLISLHAKRMIIIPSVDGAKGGSDERQKYRCRIVRAFVRARFTPVSG
jgi:hypothetical protein